jgi:Protein of unknown function (DUF1501)
MSDKFPCGRISRRHALYQFGLFGSAIGALWAGDGKMPEGADPPTLPQKAKSVILLFMCGGVSHIDTFDPKDNKWAGTMMDAIGFGDNLAERKRPVIPCRRTFTRYGQSGIPVSDWFPHVGGVIDDIAVVRSMWSHETNHFPAVIEMTTAHRGRQFDYPTLGSWVSYALGTANKDLPTFVNIGRPSSSVQLSAGYLGATYAATPFQPGATPIRNLTPPNGLSPAESDRQMQTLTKLNEEFRHTYELNSDIAARVKAYELAARMQLSAPPLVDFANEPKSVLDLYGIDDKVTDDFGRQLLLARRMAEKGVRFIQICHAGGGNGAWDSHFDMATHEPLCRATDKPIAGLITDLKQRGMLDSTLIVWTSEFGRTPWSQHDDKGRDHNAFGYSSWLAGAGIKGGTVHGATDDVGYKAVEHRHYCSDLHATIVHQTGLDYTKMNFQFNGRTFHLIEEGDGPIMDILA